MRRIRLDQASVFFDYDGTITTVDTGLHLLERLGVGEWRSHSEAFSAGQIGSRECLIAEWGSLAAVDEAELRRTASEVDFDPHFDRLVRDLRAAGAELAVVSDGFGFYVHERLAAYGINIITNAVDFSTGSLEFPNLDRCCPCTSCGTCKQAPIRDAKKNDRVTVFIGDGVSDRKAVLLADHVFAKGSLARWCQAMDIDHIEFLDLDDVHYELFGS